MTRNPPRRAGFRGGRLGADGQAIMEFVLVFPVFMLLLIGIMEFSMLSVAHQVVDYSAFAAARSACANSDWNMSAAIACIPISPAAIAGIDPGEIPGLQALESIIQEFIPVSNVIQRATFGYFLTKPGSSITYYNSSNQKTTFNSATYVSATIVYFYPLKFPLISTLAAMVSRDPLAKIPIIGDIFYVDDSTYIEYWTECEALTKLCGLEFVPIIKTCTMGMN